MNEQKFFSTRAGKLTIAFIIVMIAFAMIMFGLYNNISIMYTLGFTMIVLSMLYSPIKTHIYDKLKNRKARQINEQRANDKANL